jgi:hypothetical protein
MTVRIAQETKAATRCREGRVEFSPQAADEGGQEQCSYQRGPRNARQRARFKQIAVRKAFVMCEMGRPRAAQGARRRIDPRLHGSTAGDSIVQVVSQRD